MAEGPDEYKYILPFAYKLFADETERIPYIFKFLQDVFVFTVIVCPNWIWTSSLVPGTRLPTQVDGDDQLPDAALTTFEGARIVTITLLVFEQFEFETVTV